MHWKGIEGEQTRRLEIAMHHFCLGRPYNQLGQAALARSPPPLQVWGRRKNSQSWPILLGWVHFLYDLGGFMHDFVIRIGLFAARVGLFLVGGGLFLVRGGLFISRTFHSQSRTFFCWSRTFFCWSRTFFGWRRTFSKSSCNEKKVLLQRKKVLL